MYANINYFGIEAVLDFKIFAAINLFFVYMKKREDFFWFLYRYILYQENNCYYPVIFKKNHATFDKPIYLI